MKKRFLSSILAFILILTQLNLIPTKEVKAAEFSTTIVVEGNDKLISKDISTKINGLEALKDVLSKKGIDLEIKATDYGPELIRIGNLSKNDIPSGGWNYIIYRSGNYIIPMSTMDKVTLENGDRFIIYYGAYLVTLMANKIDYSTNMPNKNLTISLNHTYDDWATGKVNELKIENVQAKIDGKEVILAGNKIIIPEGLSNGKHILELSDYKQNGIPKVVNDIFEFNMDGNENPADSDNTNGNIFNRDNTKIEKNLDSEINNTSIFLSSISNTWSSVSLGKLGMKSKVDVLKSYSEDIAKYGVSDYSNTDLEKLVIILTANGYSPYNFLGYDLVSELYNRNIDEFLVNDKIFALLAYNYGNLTGSYKITKDRLVEKLLSQKLSYMLDGKEMVGWALSGDKVDPDITGMALSALSTEYDANPSVKTVVDKAVNTLASMETESGYISGVNGITSETLSTVILGLTSIGIDPQSRMFTKTKGDLVSALLSFKGTEGQFKHTIDGNNDNTASEQALRALIALKEFKTSGKYNFYSNHIEASKLIKYTKEVLPQTGAFIDTKLLIVLGLLFVFIGLGSGVINKRKA